MRLDLFPLHTVLFPQMQLPLHIFEARYRVMIRACIDEERPFGVALIRSGEEVGGPAEPHAVGTTARITRHEALPDGRMNIKAVGEERFRIDEMEQREPHLMASVTLDAMPVTDPREMAALAASVRGDYRKALRLTLELQGAYGTHEELPRDPERFAYFIAAALPATGQHAPALARIIERRSAARERGQAHAPAAARPEPAPNQSAHDAPELGCGLRGCLPGCARWVQPSRRAINLRCTHPSLRCLRMDPVVLAQRSSSIQPGEGHE